MKRLIYFLRRRVFVKREWLMKLCNLTGGHEWGDSGYLLGGKMADVWCKHCDFHTEIHLSEAFNLNTEIEP